MVFSCEFYNIFKNNILKNIYEWLLVLKIIKKRKKGSKFSATLNYKNGLKLEWYLRYKVLLKKKWNKTFRICLWLKI